MKKFFKSFIVNLGYFLLVNLFLILGHLWAFCGVAFNDEGIRFDTVTEAMPRILFGITPIIIGSIISVFILKNKKDFIISEFVILQLLVILGWSLFYVVNYIPNSKINNYIELTTNDKNINEQKKINTQVLRELDNKYILVDSISKNGQSVTIYFNNENKKVIVEHIIDSEKNYNIINSAKKENGEKEKIIIIKNNPDFYIKFDQYYNLSICNINDCYYTYSNCKISNNTYNYADYLSVYNSNGETYNPIEIYRNLVNASILNNENIYFYYNNS